VSAWGGEEMLLMTTTLSFSPPAANPAAAAPCCVGACPAGKDKYFSVDARHGFCGEACISPSHYPLFKVFEKNLTKASNSASPCAEQFTAFGTKYSVYNSTVQHGALNLKITLDLYGPAPKADSASPKKKTTWRHLRALNYQYTFAEYVAEYGKVYPVEEAAQREAAFDKALVAIKAHNEAVPAPSWRMGLSEHSDKTEAEWKALKGLSRAQRFAAAAPALTSSVAVAGAAAKGLPASVDWRTKGVVTPVKNQGGCGSCWAFSATESIESAVALAGGPLLDLAPQQLVDCAPNPDDCGGDGGCAGSTQPLAFKYVKSAGGMELDKDYPYKARDGTCSAEKSEFAASIKGWVDLPTNNYTALMEAVATVGPVAISVDASWGSYEEGVYSSSCGTTIDHAVQLVGYGEEKGEKYWLVRNSWGTSWGEEGYIKIKRFGEGEEPCGTDTSPGDGFGCKGGPSSIQVCGLCGILSGSSYPTGGSTVQKA